MVDHVDGSRHPAPAAARRVRATRDPRLSARVVRRFPMLYVEGADARLDRPAHVRAGSGLARVAGRLAVVQDDASFLALVDGETGAARAIALPADEGAPRLFDDRRGNKALKLDLEACVSVPADGGEILLAFGSGSTPLRERVAVFSDWASPSPRVEVVDAHALYALLRDAAAFAGSELNVEGAVLVQGRVRLFGRGNGRPLAARQPVNATCDVESAALLAYLRAPRRVPPPPPTDIVQVELGTLGGIRLGFTDAAAAGHVVLFSAVAEDSPDATTDGPVSGAALGVVGPGARVRWAPITVDGELFTGKVEGLELAAGRRDAALLVVDQDDPDAASELCHVELRGPWLDGA